MKRMGLCGVVFFLLMGIVFSATAQNLIQNGGFDESIQRRGSSVTISDLRGRWVSPPFSPPYGWVEFDEDGNKYIGGAQERKNASSGAKGVAQLIPQTESLSDCILSFRYKVATGASLRVVFVGYDKTGYKADLHNLDRLKREGVVLYEEEVSGGGSEWKNRTIPISIKGKHNNILVCFFGAGNKDKLCLDDVSLVAESGDATSVPASKPARKSVAEFVQKPISLPEPAPAPAPKKVLFILR